MELEATYQYASFWSWVVDPKEQDDVFVSHGTSEGPPSLAATIQRYTEELWYIQRERQCNSIRRKEKKQANAAGSVDWNANEADGRVIWIGGSAAALTKLGRTPDRLNSGRWSKRGIESTDLCFFGLLSLGKPKRSSRAPQLLAHGALIL